MKKRIVKALNANNEIVYVIQIRTSILFVQYWHNYSKQVLIERRAGNYWSSKPIEFKTLEDAQEALKNLEDIKLIL